MEKADERKKLEERLKALEREHGTFGDRLRVTVDERRKLEKNAKEDKEIKAKALRDRLDGIVLEDDSAKGLIEKVYKAKLGGGTSAQLNENIENLRTTEQYCRDRMAEISKEMKDIRGRIRKLDEGEALRDFIKAEDNFFQSVLSNNQAWIELKAAAKHCHSFKMNYQLSFAEHGIVNELIYKILVDVLRPNVVGFKKQMDFLDKMSRMKFLKDNKYFIEPGRANERRLGERKKIEMRRDNFKP